MESMIHTWTFTESLQTLAVLVVVVSIMAAAAAAATAAKKKTNDNRSRQWQMAKQTNPNGLKLRHF